MYAPMHCMHGCKGSRGQGNGVGHHRDAPNGATVRPALISHFKGEGGVMKVVVTEIPSGTGHQ